MAKGGAPRVLCALAVIAGLFLGAPGAAIAAPRVVASVMPIHSLVAAVMDGVGTPVLLLRGNMSPHGYSLRPSDARALARADAVVWVGAGFEVFLANALDGLAAEARVLELAKAPGVALLPAAADGDAADAYDPHLWLDPANGMAIASAIAALLTEIDPANAPRYRANAAALRVRLRALDQKIAARLAPLAGRAFVVYHDAYRYFERRYGLTPLGAITPNPERPPGARHIANLRAAMREAARAEGTVCLFVEPQFTPRLAETLAADTGARIAVLDPLGADLAPGPDAYPALLEGLAESLAGCLGGGD